MITYLLTYSADTRLKEQREAMAVVGHEGDVLWLPAAIFRSTCSVDILYFPFDIQICNLKFGSWTYDGWKLDINFHSDVGDVVSVYLFIFYTSVLFPFYFMLCEPLNPMNTRLPCISALPPWPPLTLTLNLTL